MARMNYAKQSNIEKGYNGEVFDRAELKNQQSLGKGSNKITYLEVPYHEKDLAKAQGAKWDAEEKKWYCVGDVDVFRRWVNKFVDDFEHTTLEEYLREKHPSINALTKMEASILCINYPLQKGWFKDYKCIEIPNEIVQKLRDISRPSEKQFKQYARKKQRRTKQ